MTVTIQQERVTLRCADNFVTFDWPTGADVVTVSGTVKPAEPVAYSIEEAHELFLWLMDHGAY
jgi:hypothetical protein